MSNNLFLGYMIGSKFNFVIGAAIFASTVYFLWIKIRRNTNFFHKNLSIHNISEETHDKDVSSNVSISQCDETLNKVYETILQAKNMEDKAIFNIDKIIKYPANSISNDLILDSSQLAFTDFSNYLHSENNVNNSIDANTFDILCNKMECISLNSPIVSKSLDIMKYRDEVLEDKCQFDGKIGKLNEIYIKHIVEDRLNFVSNTKLLINESNETIKTDLKDSNMQIKNCNENINISLISDIRKVKNEAKYLVNKNDSDDCIDFETQLNENVPRLLKVNRKSNSVILTNYLEEEKSIEEISKNIESRNIPTSFEENKEIEKSLIIYNILENSDVDPEIEFTINLLKDTNDETNGIDYKEKNPSNNEDSYGYMNSESSVNEVADGLIIQNGINSNISTRYFEMESEKDEISKNTRTEKVPENLSIGFDENENKIGYLGNGIISENISEETITESAISICFDNIDIVDINKDLENSENVSSVTQRENTSKETNVLGEIESSISNFDDGQDQLTDDRSANSNTQLSENPFFPNDIQNLDLEFKSDNIYQPVNFITLESIKLNKSDIIDKSETNESDISVINTFNEVSSVQLTHVNSTSNMSHLSDYLNDSSLDCLLAGNTLMEYIEDCLDDKEFDSDLIRSDDVESTGKHENWPNDENFLNNIKRDFYDQSTICSPHPSSESDHAHCVNNLTERVAILSAESILDSQYNVNSSDTEIAPILSFLTLDNANPELYVEKITYFGKELDIVYFEESVLEAGGVQTDIKIVRTIPVGLGGRIIGKKGKTKNELMKKFGAKLLIYNHPFELGKQVLEITCNPSVKDDMEKWVNKTLEQITRNTIQTTVSNPEWLKPMIPLGRLVIAHIVDMPTIQHIKLRIYNPTVIKAFNAMQKEMSTDYNCANNNPLLPRPVAVGCVCVAMIRPDFFVRAQIVEIYDDFAWIYLLDIGKICQTYLFYLYKIREKYMRIPFQVIPARLPHALIKNKNFTSEIIHKRFLCDQMSFKPKMVRVFFPRMSTCCEPCANIYIPMSTLSDTNTNDEFVDLLEVLVSMDVCTMVRETINSDIQVKINTNHFMAFLNEHDKKDKSVSNVPAYFQPCNSKFYEDFIEIKQENNSDA